MTTNGSTSVLPVLYLDVDGVLTFATSRTQYLKHAGFGRLRRGALLDPGLPVYDLFGSRSNILRLNWSAELFYKLAELPVEVVILSTWRHDFVSFKRATQWDLLENYRVLDWEDGPKNSEHSGKVPALLADQLANPRPFIWVDDEAHVFYSDADRAALSATSSLLLAPDEKFGLTRTDYDAMVSFLEDVS